MIGSDIDAKLSILEIDCLIRFYLSKRNYARDCRATQLRCKKEGYRLDDIDWDERHAQYDRHYKFYDKKIKYFRKIKNK